MALVLLSIGAIGMLGLQVSAAKSSVDAKYQNAALDLASDLSAMMRSNPTVSTWDSASENPYLIDKNTAPSTMSEGAGLSFVNSAKGIAQNDINQWYARGYTALPGFRAVVCFDANPYDASGAPKWACTGGSEMVYIKIGWSLRQGSAGVDQNLPGVVIPVGVCHPTKASATSACVGI